MKRAKLGIGRRNARPAGIALCRDSYSESRHPAVPASTCELERDGADSEGVVCYMPFGNSEPRRYLTRASTADRRKRGALGQNRKTPDDVQFGSTHVHG